MSLKIVSPAFALVLIVGCGGDAETVSGAGAATSPTPSAVSCPSIGSADGSSDTLRGGEGARSISAIQDFGTISLDAALAEQSAVAVLRVDSRRVGQLRVGSNNLAAATPSSAMADEVAIEIGPTSEFHIVRPVSFAVERELKGTVPECITLDIPGGSTPGFVSDSGLLFPETLAPGDRVVTVFGETSPVRAVAMFSLDAQDRFATPYQDALMTNLAELDATLR